MPWSWSTNREVAFVFPAQPDCDLMSLADIAAIMKDSDVSPFEVIHSGLVGKLLTYLTHQDDVARETRLRCFLHVFLGCPVSPPYNSPHLNEGQWKYSYVL